MAQSYFWSCLTLSDECPFLSSNDPNLVYYGSNIDYYIILVRKKLQRVQMDQTQLITTQQRAENQLKRSIKCIGVVNALRLGLTGRQPLPGITENPGYSGSARRTTWSECHSETDTHQF
ncbi:Arginase [Operophtera brumata]|uniref:Arginase n=1 Tax=Operophtera brumata TaxID=104452 RepID=A0A0L7KV43_OPEBR|nr:Arginase [Operophtera brumata]